MFCNPATSLAVWRLSQILTHYNHQQMINRQGIGPTHLLLHELPVLPSTHPAPVLFPPAGQPLSAAGLVRCSLCYLDVSLFTHGEQPLDRSDEWCRSDL